VLVVDDCPDTATSMEVLLRLWGHDVRVAHDGPAALNLAQTYHPDAVFLDIGLPGMDGFQVAQRLHERPELSDTLLFSLSGYGQESDRQHALESGCACHLVKPVDPNMLRTLLGICRLPRLADAPGEPAE
jgi:CheY-like chemotaxis protein